MTDPAGVQGAHKAAATAEEGVVDELISKFDSVASFADSFQHAVHDAALDTLNLEAHKDPLSVDWAAGEVIAPCAGIVRSLRASASTISSTAAESALGNTRSEFVPDPWLGLLSDASAGQPTRRSRSRSLRRAPSHRSQSPPSSVEIRGLLQQTQSDDPAVAMLHQPDYGEDPGCVSQTLVRRAWFEVDNLDIPIKFELGNPNCRDTLETLIGQVVGGRFYIGATQSPTRRWLGSWSERDDKPMKGHCEKWDFMCLIALRADARQLEKQFIEEAKHRWPGQCTNVAADCRGQCRGFNWIYVCF